MAEQNTPQKKQPKKKGPIRWEAIVPTLVIFAVIFGYFHFFFDHHLKSAIEVVGYNVMGAEVNVAKVETSFFKASLSIQGIDLTDAEQPARNMVSIGDIRYQMLWDALLRAKFVVEEAAIERIEFGKPRSKPGQVKPPEPEDNSPSFLETEGSKLKDKALDQVEEKYDENVMGDIASILGGGSTQVQMDKLDSQLVSKQKSKELEAFVNQKKTDWEQKLKALPKAEDFQALGQRLGQVKTSNFNSPEELQKSITQIDQIFKEADSKYKELQTANTNLNSDLNSLQTGMKDLEAQIKNDIKELEKHFKIPRLDAKSIAMSLFMPYVQPYKAQFLRYKNLFYKYAPPNLLNKDKEPEVAIQPKPRSVGVTYEFGRQNAYPLVWIKKTSISSQAGFSPYSGFIQGQIKDITTNQVQIGRPTVAEVKGDFPAAEIKGFATKLILDNTKAISNITLDAQVASFPVLQKNFVSSPDVTVGFNKAIGQSNLQASLKGYKDFSLEVKNIFQNIDYNVAAKEKNAEDILKRLFGDIKSIDLNVASSGVLPKMNLYIASNIGTQIQNGIQKEIEAQVAAARKKINDYVEAEVAKNKKQIEAQIQQFRSQYEGEIKKLQQQAEDEKKKAEAKTDQAKKDAENQAKSKLEQEGKKAVDDLKKKLGF